MRTEKEYDSHGRVIKETSYHSNGAVKKEMLFREDGRFREAYEYYSDGKLFQELRYDERGSIALWYDYEYDLSGRVTKKTELFPNAKIKGYTEYEYDSDGSVTEERNYVCDGRSVLEMTCVSKGVLKYRRKYEYKNEHGKISRELLYDSDGLLVKEIEYHSNLTVGTTHEYEYDSDGKCVKEKLYDPDGDTEWVVYEYNEDGKESGMIYYNSDGTVSFYNEKEYGTDDCVIKETYYNADGSIDYFEEYTTDTDRMVVIVTTHKADGTVETEEYGYGERDSDGRVAKEYEYTDDGKMLTVEHKYNSEGDRTGRICRDYDGNMLWYSRLEYYPNDWIKKETYYNPEGRVLYWEDFEIDEDKMTVTMTRYLPDGTVETEEYKYDSDGNVT